MPLRSPVAALHSPVRKLHRHRQPTEAERLLAKSAHHLPAQRKRRMPQPPPATAPEFGSKVNVYVMSEIRILPVLH